MAISDDRIMYRFAAGGVTDGHRGMRDILGGKGANLAEMCILGVPVPPGFTLATSLCHARDDAQVQAALAEGIAHIENSLGDSRTFASAGGAIPLLVSVRSGAPISMPGMMDSVLNVGVSRHSLAALGQQGGERFALDAYRRLLQMFGNVVSGIDREKLEAPLTHAKSAHRVDNDADLDVGALATVVDELERVFVEETGANFPQDPLVQLQGAVEAVFRSWHTERAKHYRRINGIGSSHRGCPLGTAATIQLMVFGNGPGDDSGTGVVFSRNPSTGEKGLMGEWLANAQGEDVVAGIRTPHPLTRGDRSFAAVLPQQFASLVRLAERLESTYRDVQDIEFTVDHGELFILQTRVAKRTAGAALRCAMEMLDEGLIDEIAAVGRVSCAQLDQLLHPQIDPQVLAEAPLLGTGLAASPGAASGEVVIDADAAAEAGKAGKSVILVRHETSPEDIHGMHAAKGVVTATGGLTSHAAVVARGMGRPCICGVETLRVDARAGRVTFDGVSVAVGEELTIDGATGHVYQGVLKTVATERGADFDRLLQIADSLRHNGVRANADTPEDAIHAVELGAEGIGLCRTEHMFFSADRIAIMREMIVAPTDKDRQRALDRLEPMQRADFIAIFRAMAGKPVTIRLLDPPLHEFLPAEHDDAELHSVACTMDIEVEELRERVIALHEYNPMLGHRGCRLGLTYPAIYRMQARAVLDAAVIVKSSGIEVFPEIMVPLVIGAKELALCRADVDRVAEQVFATSGERVDYLVGTMIELPRAVMMAEEIAAHADFFSFGTNDLTQTTLGISRDDAGRFLPSYQELGIMTADPFVTLDQAGVGQLVTMGAERGRAARPGLKIGVCGEHGGDPASIEFFIANNFDYISCSPYRLPIARLAMAQATVALAAAQDTV